MAGDAQTARDAGFTMIEMVVAVAILAVAAAVVGVRSGRLSDRDAVNQAAQEIASRFRSGRLLALRGGAEQTVVFDALARTVAVRGTGGMAGTGRPYAVPESVTLVATVSSSERAAIRSKTEERQLAGIRFYADGSSTGGTFRLNQGAVAADVRVNWLTGRVSVDPVR
jgi:general secretion pathway protein H